VGVVVQTSSDTVASTAVASGLISLQVTSVTFSIASSDRVVRFSCVPVTLSFTAAVPIPNGGTITLTYPSGFFASSITPFVAGGASSVAGLTATCGATSATSVVIYTSGATIGASAFTVTIRGFTIGAPALNAVGILVQTSLHGAASIAVASGATQCPAGTFLEVNSSALMCMNCQKGQFCPGIGNVQPTNCLAGKFCSNVGLAAVSGECLAGSYSAGSATTAACTPCPAGKHCASAGLAAVSGECLAGSYSAGNATTAACTPCPAGKYCASAGLAAVSGECLAGSYSAGNATTAACTPCPAGKFCSADSLSFPSGECPASSFSVGGSRSSGCIPCAAGYFGRAAGLSVCQLCPSGYISQSGSVECQALEHELIILTLTGSIETFSEGSDRRRSFVAGLASIISTPVEQIVIMSVRSGSVIVDLAFVRDSTSSVSPLQAAMRLKEAAVAGKLEELGATDLLVGGKALISPSSPSQVPVVVGSSIGGVFALVLIGLALRKILRKKKTAIVLDIPKDFQEIDQSYIVFDSSFIAQGSFGVVRKGDWGGNIVAVKQMLQKSSDEKDRKNFIREAKTMHGISHPNCVRLYGICTSTESLSLVIEWMDGGDLSEMLQKPQCPPLHRRLSLFRQICSGLKYLHTEKSITHSDIKASNILLSSDCKTAKIADFGLSKMREQGTIASTARSTTMGINGTIIYLPPEHLLEAAPSDRTGDIYAMGCLLWEIVTCKVMWNGMLPAHIFTALHKAERPEIPSSVDPEISALIRDCWANDPASRPLADDLWRRVSALDVNNYNKPLVPYCSAFEPTCASLEDCMKRALDPETLKYLSWHITDGYSYEDKAKKTVHVPSINEKFQDPLLQSVIRQHGLTELEAKCIILYTLESHRVSKHRQFHYLFNQAYRQRNDEALELFADFSFHFWRGIAKLPSCSSSLPSGFNLYRGIRKRLADINDLYQPGNTIHWHSATSCSSDMSVAKQSFARNGGTLLSIGNAKQAKSVELFSVLPKEKEYLLDFTCVLTVQGFYTSEEVKALAAFSKDLPSDVDLVVLIAKDHEDASTPAKSSPFGRQAKDCIDASSSHAAASSMSFKPVTLSCSVTPTLPGAVVESVSPAILMTAHQITASDGLSRSQNVDDRVHAAAIGNFSDSSVKHSANSAPFLERTFAEDKFSPQTQPVDTTKAFSQGSHLLSSSTSSAKSNAAPAQAQFPHHASVRLSPELVPLEDSRNGAL